MTELDILKSGVAVKFEKVTLYRSGEMMGNYSAIECREVTLRIAKYAQYENALEVSFVKKGARKARRFFATYAPSVVVVDGYRAFEPDSLFGAPTTETTPAGSVTFQRGRHTGFGAGWAIDFSAGLAKWAAETGRAILADFHGWNSHRGDFEKAE